MERQEECSSYRKRDEMAVLQYIDWQDVYEKEKPYQVFSAMTETDLPGQMSTNLVFKDGEAECMHDIRGFESSFDLDTHGFAFCQHHLDLFDFENSAKIETIYLPQMEALLRREVEGVDQAYFFDWRIRKNIELNGQSVIDANDKMQHLLPAKHVHLDQSPSAVVGRVRTHLPEQADFLLRGRVRLINLWRPLVDVIEDRPLAVCDSRTIEPGDLVEADHIRRHYNGSNYYARPSPNYRWFYLNQQRRSEITLLKIFDSAPGSARGDSAVLPEAIRLKMLTIIPGSLHTSFNHTHVPDSAQPRESIEVRALVFTYADK